MRGCANSVDELLRSVWQALTEGPPVILASHRHPDGDAVGATLALWHALRDRGVEAQTVLEPPSPPALRFLPGMERCCIEEPVALAPRYILAVVDCGSFERLGAWTAPPEGCLRVINVDHHRDNDLFGDLILVDPEASSSGELIHRLLKSAGAPLTPAIATCLYAAVAMDTGWFAYENTTPGALEACAECVAAGARPVELSEWLNTSLTRAEFDLHRLAAATLELHCGGRAASLVVTAQMFDSTGLGPTNTEGLADIPLTIQGVMAGALLKELPQDGYIKVSLRSRAPVDVGAVAGCFGGGGHARAAGCEIADSLANARAAVVERLCAALRPAPDR